MGARPLTAWLAAALAGVLVAGCAHERPPPIAERCDYRALPLKVAAPRRLGEAGLGGSQAPTFEGELADTLAPEPAPGLTAPAARPREFAVLSGGSQHGAFGGGLFIGLPKTPTYDVVTGVSTGALLSTLVFLANDPPPGDRAYPRDVGEGTFPPGRSNLGDLGVALSISSEASLLRVARSRVYGGLVQGSVGSLQPLRERLTGFVSDDTLRLIKQARLTQGRKLFVGVTDLDDGLGYAIDLTELASRIDDPSRSPNDAPTLRRCYVDALIASSSVPLAAYPVTLDIRPEGETASRRDLFVDGGVRFGVFLRQVGDELARRRVRGPTNVTVVVNGKLYSRDWNQHGRRPLRWSSITLVQRTVSLLTNQVYRFSVDDAERFPRNGGALRVAFISNEGLGTLDEDPDAHVYEDRTCQAWSDEDDRANPFEFHPRYMACLLDYGRARGARDPWNLMRPTAP